LLQVVDDRPFIVLADMVLLFFLGLHGTLVAVSAQFMMSLRDSDIPMNVPFTFSNKQPLTPRGELVA
jgi:hypothetical protein